MRIWKFPLDITDRQTLAMPEGAKMLDVQMQGDTCCLWAMCDQNAPMRVREVAIYGTGNPMPNDPGEYVATFQMHGGALVFHAFEVAANAELNGARRASDLSA